MPEGTGGYSVGAGWMGLALEGRARASSETKRNSSYRRRQEAAITDEGATNEQGNVPLAFTRNDSNRNYSSVEYNARVIAPAACICEGR